MAEGPRPAAAGWEGKVPIVVGVTGHRDVVEEPSDPGSQRPRVAVRERLRRLLEAYPHTPIVVLSGLAEGADALAAEVALDLAEEPEGKDAAGAPRVSVVAALPMPLEAYTETFEPANRAAHLERVRRLLRGAAGSYVLEHAVDLRGSAERGSTEEQANRRDAQMHEQYARLAAHLAQSSHVLLALWDGRDPRAGTRGGTAEVVSWFRHGVPPERADEGCDYDPLRLSGGLLLEHVPVLRANFPGALPQRVPVSAEEAEIATHSLGRIEIFNADVEARGARVREDLRSGEAAFRKDLPEEAHPFAPLRPYVLTREAAGSLAGLFQALRRRCAVVVFLLTFVAVLAFELFAHGGSLAHHGLVLLGYVLLFVASFAVVLFGRWRRIEVKYLVYRSFSEALRVQAAWLVAGVGRHVGEHYDELHRSEVDWISQGLKGLHVVSRAIGPPLPAAPTRTGVTWAARTWVEDQTAWFEKRHASMRTKARACTTVFLAATFSALALALALGVATLALGMDHPVVEHGHQPALILVVLLTVFGGLSIAWSEFMAYEASARRYRGAHALYARAAARLRDVLPAAPQADLAAAAEILRSLGREALRENTAWLLLHRDRPLEVLSKA